MFVKGFFEISLFFTKNFKNIVDFSQFVWYILVSIHKEVTKMEKKTTTIADRLREALDAAGKKQVDLVRDLGLDRGAVSSYLSGKYEPKQKAIYKMAQYLDVSEAWLLGYEVPKHRTADQKKNDELAKLVVKMRSDVDFYNTVLALSKLNEKQYRGVQQLIAAFDE